jgi:hypothetical protein
VKVSVYKSRCPAVHMHYPIGVRSAGNTVEIS